MGGKRRTFTDEAGCLVRRCRGCEHEFPLDEEHFSPSERDPNSQIVKWSYECKPCAKKRKSKWYAQAMADRFTGDRLRAAARVRHKRWREEHPELVKAAVRRKRERIMADPERYARHLENRRIEYALRCERRGKPVNRHISTVVRASEKYCRLPAAPLAAFLDVELSGRQVRERALGLRDAISIGEFCCDLDLDPRSFYAWRVGERKEVQLAVAERVLHHLGLDWERVWPSEDFPELYTDGGPLCVDLEEAA